jgi:hypothetical protein
MNNDNRIKFIDMLVCGSCQQDFQLSDIVKFIEHKAVCGNKENKRKIPYFLSQRRQREGDNDDDYDDDEDDENDDNKSQLADQSSGSENENSIHRSHPHRRDLTHKQSTPPKVLVDTSGNAPKNTSASPLVSSKCDLRILSLP